MKYTVAVLFFIFSTLLSSLSGAAAEKIWDVAGQKAITEQSLINKLIRARNILIGIQTDNPADYNHSARIIADLAEAGRQPVILLGTIERDKQNAFAIFRHRHRGSAKTYDATGLDMLLEWSSSSPLNWAIVRPLFDVAMIRKLSLIAAAFSRYEVGRLYHNGLDGLPADVRNNLLALFGTPLPKKLKVRLFEEIRATYCTSLPPEVSDKLITVDRAQSGLFAVMIAAIAKKADGKTPVLVSPQKYILADSGVRRYLRQLGVRGRTASLLFLESGRGQSTPKVDYIWYTDKIPRQDSCRFLHPDQP